MDYVPSYDPLMCGITEKIDMVGKEVTLCCCKRATHRVEEVDGSGPTVHYLCYDHRKDLLPMCNPESGTVKITRLRSK